nr:IclR family transcriptional regulator C-terminal domain-containing protein [Ancylobacter oerskovii]
MSKALSLMKVIAERGRNGMTLSAAAKRAEIHIATAHRLLVALVEEDFLNFDPYTKLYHLGLMPYEIVARAGTDLEFVSLRKKLRPYLERAQAEAGGIVSLSVVSRSEALCVDVVEGHSDIRLNTLTVGSRRPLGAGAASLALLAAQDAAEREATIAREAERYLKYGSLTADLVRTACEGLRSDGYVFNEAWIIPDIGALGIPLFSTAPGAVCAVSLTNTISRLSPDRRREIAVVLSRAAQAAGFKTMDIP